MSTRHSAFRIQHSALWVWWIPLVWVVSTPWVGFTREPQWHRVHFVPLTDPADRVRDIVANVLLFVPFGYSAAGRKGATPSFLFAVGAAAAVSVSAEASQLFSTARYPSATDVAAAIVGSAIGAAAALSLRRSPKKPGGIT